MALEIKGLQRIFKFRKDSKELVLSDPDSEPVRKRGDGLLLHDLSRTDNGDRSRTGMGGRQGGLPLQDNHRSERISVWTRERKRRTNHADSSQNQPRRTWRDSLSDRPTRQTSEEEHRDKKGGYCRHREAS